MTEIKKEELDALISLRGETPEDIRQTCFQLSQKYLAGVWLQISIDDIEVKRLSGGFTNQIYLCKIINDVKPIGDEPEEVAIRLYGIKYFNNTDIDQLERVTDTIVCVLVSENGLGPKVYGIFKSGLIMAYYEHKYFTQEEQKDMNLVKELSSKLAKIHSMKVPIKKNDNWFFDSFDQYYETASQRFSINDLAKEYDCQTLMNNDLETELKWIKDLMIKTNSPIVFTHNDFRSRNIMITENNGIIFCDFDHSSYGYRGMDFGSLFAEWGRSLTDFKETQKFPEDFIIKPFIDNYICESISMNGNQYLDKGFNSYEQILLEVKVFVLAANLNFSLLTLKNDNEFPLEKEVTMLMSEFAFKNYLDLKKQFTQYFQNQNKLN